MEAGYGMMEGCSVLPLQLRFVPCGIGGACGGAWIGCAAAKPLLVGGGTGLLAGSRASLRSSVHSDRATMLHAPRLPPPPRPCNAAVLIGMLESSLRSPQIADSSLLRLVCGRLAGPSKRVNGNLANHAAKRRSRNFLFITSILPDLGHVMSLQRKRMPNE